MKNENKLLCPVVCAFLLSSGVVYAADGYREVDVSGEINTAWLLAEPLLHQLGTITIDDGKGKDDTCGLFGTITGVDESTGLPATLTHLISCKGNSTMTTVDEIYLGDITPVSLDFLSSCASGVAFHVIEHSYIDSGTGKFSGASGDLISEGDICVGGENILDYEGTVYLPEDAQ